MRKLLLPLLSLLVFPTLAQEPSSLTDRTFQLGEVRVSGISHRDSLSSRLTYRTIEQFSRNDLSNALNILPGVTMANVGPRNESVVYVRGFDLRQVPVYIDGVPVYVPYDGYVDKGRFTTFDLAEVNVSKGFASILYGANTMGGAINLVSRKPVNKFEINGRAGVFSGGGYRWNVNAGSRLGKFFYQVGASQLKQDTYPLSADFKPRKFQQTDDRENAYRDDLKFSVKAGFTPNATDEYVIGYINQHGEKGTPPYVGDDSKITTRFWKWPKWNKQSLYFISNTAVGAKSKVKTRLYYDTFVNSLFSFDDTTYTAQTKGYAFQSFYDDYTLGGNAEFESRAWENNVFKFNVQYKRDIHRENDKGEPVQSYIDNTISIGIENTYQIIPSLAVVPGVSFNARNASQAQEYNATTKELSDFSDSKNNAVNAQIGLFWDITASHSLRGSVARKTRFATIKDRYSYRMGQAIPNPDLHAEVALNFDLSYSGKIADKLALQASIFQSNIDDIIQQVDNVQPNRFQLQNAGKARFYGAEAGFEYQITTGLKLGSNYSFIKRKNKTNPSIPFTNVPEHKVFAYADFSFLKVANLLASLENNSSRYSTSYGTKAGAYTLLDAKVSVKLYKFISTEAGINNILDKNYTLIEGFPEAGRNFFINLVFNYF
ncbi:TonB-dependent receptor plug domain-containing protein [Dyadobacter fermentans]|uniref:TonB-dependent receptor n=1 Tax=Dyadobacter fermentans (strain ATCC 700827 / DSM 18053 / CIP 107007 / KCTC 52180 / NS114) TaxID=471854 RepID=C6VU52_DYAFD|nr:TonB-dependent receptor [Dyadobacter fermentans]ACT96534.1 TonB-dependent receptor [Dyadobacter fermentans DSM 18053]